jgi:hypothetical protein
VLGVRLRRAALQCESWPGRSVLGDETVQTGEFIAVGALGLGIALIAVLTRSLVARTRRRRQMSAEKTRVGPGRNGADVARRKAGRGKDPADSGSDTPEEWLGAFRSLQAGPAPRYARSPQSEPPSRPPQPPSRPQQPDPFSRSPQPDPSFRPPRPDLDRYPPPTADSRFPGPDPDRYPPPTADSRFPGPDPGRRPPRPEPNRRRLRRGQDPSPPRPEPNPRGRRPGRATRAPEPELNGRPVWPEPTARSPRPESNGQPPWPDLGPRPPRPEPTFRPSRPEPNGRPPWPDLDGRGQRPEPTTRPSRPEPNGRPPGPALDRGGLRPEPSARQPWPESNGQRPWANLDRHPMGPEPTPRQLAPEPNRLQLPPAPSRRQLPPPEPNDSPSVPDLERVLRGLRRDSGPTRPQPTARPSRLEPDSRPTRPQPTARPSRLEPDSRPTRPQPTARPSRLEPDSRPIRPEMDDGPSWSEPIPRPLRPESIPRPPQPDPDLLPSDFDRRPQREPFPGQLPPEPLSRPLRPDLGRGAAGPDPGRQTSWPGSMPRPSRPESAPGRPLRGGPAGPGMNEGLVPGLDSGYDTGPVLGYGPRPYAERGRRRDLEYDPDQATQQGRISGRKQPPQDDYWQPDGTSRSPGPSGAWSSPVQDDGDRGGYGDRRPIRPAAGQDPPARFAGGQPGWATGPQPAYPSDALPPYGATPYQADVEDTGYSAYSGAAGSESSSFSEVGVSETVGDDTSPLPVVLDMGDAMPEPFRDDESWPPQREAESAAATWEPHPRGPLGPETGGPAGNGAHWPDLPAPEQDAAAQAKLEQLKDLYLTAEAIGDDALGKHFEELSQRQRSLITEYFSHRGLRPSGPSTAPGDERP